MVHTSRLGASAASPDGKGADLRLRWWLLPLATTVVVLLLPMAPVVVQRGGGSVAKGGRDRDAAAL
jgi:hypothetical protein